MRDDGAAPRTSVGKQIVTYGTTLVVAAVAIYGMSEYLSPIQKPKQGDCAYLTGPSGEGRYNAVDCSAPNANYVVAGTVGRSETCPNPADADWVPRRTIDPKIRFCLVPLYAESECYPEARPGYDLDVVDCTEGSAFRVTKVSSEVPAPSCVAGEQTRAFPEVRLTYCVVAQ